MILTRGGRSHRKGLHSGRKAARLSCFARGSTDKEFRKEWLYRILRKERQSTQVLFTRATDNEETTIDFGAQLRGENRTIAKLTRINSLFLSTAVQNNHPQLTPIYKYFASNWEIVIDDPIKNDINLAARLIDFGQIDPLMSLVRQADLGISKFEIMDEEPDEKRIKMLEDVPEAIGKHLPPSNAAEKFGESAIEEIRQAKQLRFMHRSSDTESHAFRYSMESKGTQVLISLLIPALEALGKV